TQALFQALLFAFGSHGRLRPTGPHFVFAAYAVYASIFLFNLTMTLVIRDYRLTVASGIVVVGTLAPIAWGLRRRQALLTLAPLQPDPDPVGPARRSS
ncbi:MAG TPA: hypothetical protein VHW01_11510, partial [Polyangiaceae bacterium]|nr:hypothetical protein [Polyangiaceae bacterium]